MSNSFLSALKERAKEYNSFLMAQRNNLSIRDRRLIENHISLIMNFCKLFSLKDKAVRALINKEDEQQKEDAQKIKDKKGRKNKIPRKRSIEELMNIRKGNIK